MARMHFGVAIYHGQTSNFEYDYQDELTINFICNPSTEGGETKKKGHAIGIHQQENQQINISYFTRSD